MRRRHFEDADPAIGQATEGWMNRAVVPTRCGDDPNSRFNQLLFHA